MKLKVWVDTKLEEAKRKGEAATRRSILESLAATTGVSLASLSGIDRGQRLTKYDLAKAVSEATGWEVTIPDLCDAAVTPQVQAQFDALRSVMVLS